MGCIRKSLIVVSEEMATSSHSTNGSFERKAGVVKVRLQVCDVCVKVTQRTSSREIKPRPLALADEWKYRSKRKTQAEAICVR
jgi:hypothetical protein